MNYYERHIGDYLKDTAHLSLLEHGVYTRLLDVYYTRECGIPADEAARLVGARLPAERAALAAVLAEFFELQDGLHTQARADREVAHFQDKQVKAKASADARWNAQRSQSERNANASHRGDAPAMRTHPERISAADANGMPHARLSQSPDTNQEKEKEKETSLLAQAPARPSAEPLALVPGKPEKTRPPDCPHLEILALWAEVLPALPQHDPERWRGAKADHLRTRWRETAVVKGWIDAQAGIAYFRKLFGYVGRSAFLTGRAPPSAPGKRPFVIELEWLVNLANWDKVHEGKYHPEQAA